ncbi:MAG: hypothetical protein WAV83_05190, partial [Methanothrix sp.]
MAGLIFGAIILASTANCISISVSGDGGGFTEVIDAGYDDRVFGRTVIGSNRLSNIIEGGGNLKETHSVSNTAGATAEVGVNISQAEWFSYSYNLWPGEGSSWKASKYAQVAASEALEVSNANYIRAYADAFNSNGYSASVSIELSDPAKKASLAEYRNLAMASKDEVFASQTADSVFSLDGEIQFDAQAGLLQMKPLPASFREDLSTASMKIDRGAAEGYSDLASASSQGMTASQQVDRAMGELIQTRSEASSLAASHSQSLKAADSRINTRIEGNLTGYAASAESLDGVVQTDKEGHIIGSFISTAVAGKERKSRTSNYGTEYDFVMHARRNASTSYANGFLGYYVANGRPIDNVSPTGNRIQGAVDASESGDTINIAPGTYFENVKVDKSLDIKGAGADKTIVDGRTDTSGSYQDMLRSPKSVFIVGREDPQVDVSIFGVTIQGGSGTFTKFDYIATRYDGYAYPRCGGGILNFATLELSEVAVSDNFAVSGGGIANIGGTLSLKDNSYVANNQARDFGGGIYNSLNGTVTLSDGSYISNNTADYNGGGVYNKDGVLTLNDDSHISYNVGDGVHNLNNSLTTLNDDSHISDNMGSGVLNNLHCALTLNDNSSIRNNSPWTSRHLRSSSGGVYNYQSEVNLNDNSHISDNIGYYGGGIINKEGIVVLNDNSYINKNIALQEGGGIFNSVSGAVNLYDNSHISDNVAIRRGGGILNSWQGYGNCAVNLYDNSYISGNEALYEGGGIYNYDYGTVSLNNNSHISGNDAVHRGGGVASSWHGLLSLNDDSYISGNAAYEGGGVFSGSYSQVNLNKNSYISGNSAHSGSGIFSHTNSTIELNDQSRISGNIAENGGGVWSSDHSTVSLNDHSSISGNGATYGGGIYNYYGSTVRLSGQSNVAENVATYGAGVYNLDNSTVNLLENGSISNNSAVWGGGIHSSSYSAVNLSGSSSIRGNTAYKGGGILNINSSMVSLNDDSHIVDNTAYEGSGIWSSDLSTVSLSDYSSISGNIAK